MIGSSELRIPALVTGSWLVAACASGMNPSNGAGGVAGTGGAGASAAEVGGTSAATGGALSAGGTGGTLGPPGGAANTGGSGVIVIGTGGGPVDGGACAATMLASTIPHVNLIFIVDKTGSMGATDQAVRWDPMVAGLTRFLNGVTSSAMYASLTFFPAPCGLDLTPGAGGGCVCDANEYNPDTVTQTTVPLTRILGHASTFTTLLNSTSPDGGTPTIAALQGSYVYASLIQARARLGEQTSVILITDGVPGFGCPLADGGSGVEGCEGCTGNNVNTITTLVQACHDQGIDTRVFSLGNLPALGPLANAGGWPMVTINVGDAAATTQQFVVELAKIQQPVFQCSAPVPAIAPDATPLDRNKVNVGYTSSSQTTPELLYSNPGCAATSNGAVGWQYVGDTVELCPDTCNQLKTDASPALILEFGCPRIHAAP
jgi:hypothetical protein